MTKHTNSSDTTSTVVGPLFDTEGREETAAERGEIERRRKRGGEREKMRQEKDRITMGVA